MQLALPQVLKNPSRKNLLEFRRDLKIIPILRKKLWESISDVLMDI